MPVVVVANPKGGVGKSTLSTNVAGYFASQGHKVMLGDADRQQSSRLWLGLRPPTARPIVGWDVSEDRMGKLPKGVTHVVLDTPAGLHGGRMKDALRHADKVVVPLQPSPFDLAATHAFLQVLAGHKRGGKLGAGGSVALVAMRVKEHTHATQHLHAFLEAVAPAPLNIPVTHLRDTQNYAHLAARGLTLFDVAPGRVERDLQQWLPLTTWLTA